MSLVGKNFGRWSVQSVGEPYISPSGYHSVRYNCVCSCGQIKLVRETSLISGDSSSCGCYAADVARDRVTTHGFSSHPLFTVWYDMNRRCTIESRKDFKHYGGRGIKVCGRWVYTEDCAGFINFLDDMQDSYIEGLEIDRVNVNGDYTKDNCKWSTRREQVINRRTFETGINPRFISHNGKTLCISQWADETKIPAKVIVDRIGKLNWSFEDAINIPVRVKKVSVLIDSIDYTLRELFLHPPNLYNYSKKANINMHQFIANLLSGYGVLSLTSSGITTEIEPTQDTSRDLSKFRLTKKFQEMLKSRGWNGN